MGLNALKWVYETIIDDKRGRTKKSLRSNLDEVKELKDKKCFRLY